MDVRAHVLVSGRVQGVFFRASAKDAADALGIRGWVRNLSCGGVEAVFEGEKEKVEKMIDWCWHGPPAAEVSGVEVDYCEVEGESGFEVLRTHYPG